VTESQISRREFLKFLGSGAVALGLGVFGFNSFLKNRNTVNYKNNNAIAQSAGSWDAPINQPSGTTTIHAALIAGGKVVWIMGSGNQDLEADGPYRHGIWNPNGSFGSTNTLSDDLFCCGMASLASGNVLLAGGTLEFDYQTLNGKWHGAKCAYEVNFSSGSIGTRTEMAHGRWYPTCVTLPDGKVFVVQGWDEYGCDNKLPEFYDPDTKSWQIKLSPSGSSNYCVGSCATAYYPEAGSLCYGPGAIPLPLSLYPRMHLMPSGLIASVGYANQDRVYDPNTGKWLWSGPNIVRHYGASVLLPLENTDTEKGKILICGGSPNSADPSTNTAEIVAPSGTNGLSRRSVQSMQYARKHISPVILPTGQIVIFGGNLQTSKSPVLYPEMFEPKTESWTVWPAATVPRLYHSVGLLLHDGRVWTAGTTIGQTPKEPRIEIFKPWYISETRPTISGQITGGSYGGTITIPTPNAAAITKVSLVKTSAMTHHYNTDQRLIWLQISGTIGSSITVKAPINNKLAPPGYYLIHVLNGAGVPSIGTYIKIPGSANNPPPPASYTSIYSVTGGAGSYGKLYTGSLKRAGELMHKNSTYNSALIGQPVKRVKVILAKSGSPTGTVSVVVRKASDDSVAHTFGTISASTLTTSDQTFTLEPASAYTIAANDRILVEWGGTGSSTHQVWVKRSAANTSGGFDGQNTKWSQYATSYSNQGGYDLAGEWFKLA
jgi:Domain of unknown function (DUF1929)